MRKLSLLVIMFVLITTTYASCQSDTTKSKVKKSYYDYLPDPVKPSPPFILGEYRVEVGYSPDTSASVTDVDFSDSEYELISCPYSPNYEIKYIICNMTEKQYYDMMSDSTTFMYATDQLSIVICGMSHTEQELMKDDIGTTYDRMFDNINRQFIDRVVPFFEISKKVCNCNEKP